MTQNLCCEPADIQGLRRALSAERLDFWKDMGAITDEQALVLHKRNMFISSCLYSDLQALEITLRNILHERFEAVCGSDHWWDTKKFKDRLRDRKWANHFSGVISFAKKQAQQSPLYHKILVQLPLGAWISIIENDDLWDGLVESCFNPALEKVTIREHAAEMLRLRNTIAHHEPVIDQDNIGDKFRKLVTLLNALSPEMARWVQRHSLVPKLIPIRWRDLGVDLPALCLESCSLQFFLHWPFHDANASVPSV